MGYFQINLDTRKSLCFVKMFSLRFLFDMITQRFLLIPHPNCNYSSLSFINHIYRYLPFCITLLTQKSFHMFPVVYMDSGLS